MCPCETINSGKRCDWQYDCRRGRGDECVRQLSDVGRPHGRPNTAIARYECPIQLELQTGPDVRDPPRANREPATQVTMKEGRESSIVNPFDALEQECFVHPPKPPTRLQTQLLADEGEVGELFVRTIVISHEDVPVRCLELMQQCVAGQGNVGGLTIQGNARA